MGGAALTSVLAVPQVMMAPAAIAATNCPQRMSQAPPIAGAQRRPPRRPQLLPRTSTAQARFGGDCGGWRWAPRLASTGGLPLGHRAAPPSPRVGHTAAWPAKGANAQAARAGRASAERAAAARR